MTTRSNDIGQRHRASAPRTPASVPRNRAKGSSGAARRTIETDAYSLGESRAGFPGPRSIREALIRNLTDARDALLPEAFRKRLTAARDENGRLPRGAYVELLREGEIAPTTVPPSVTRAQCEAVAPNRWSLRTSSVRLEVSTRERLRPGSYNFANSLHVAPGPTQLSLSVGGRRVDAHFGEFTLHDVQRAEDGETPKRLVVEFHLNRGAVSGWAVFEDPGAKF